MAKGAPFDAFRIILAFVLSYVAQIILVIGTNTDYIFLALTNLPLIIASTTVLDRFAVRMFSATLAQTIRPALLYTGVTSVLWWVILVAFIFSGGNQLAEVVSQSFPEFIYSFAGIAICCLIVYAFRRRGLSDVGGEIREKYFAAGVGALVTTGFAILIWLIVAIVIP